MYKKSFSRILKSIALILIFTCSVLFTNIALTQPKDSQSSSGTEQKDDTEESKTFLYVGIAAILVVGAIYFLVTNKSDKDKKTESEKNTNVKDSANIIKTDTVKVKK